MRILIWHGWLLEGSGSNVYTARVTELFRRQGHDVLLLCQEPHPERYRFLDAWGAVGPGGVEDLHDVPADPAPGRAVLLRPRIGRTIPVFVLDEYEGFEAKRFLDLSGEELDAYLEANVAALREAAKGHISQMVVASHAIPGPVVARRALGEMTYVAKVHGSDLEYALREQERFVELAREGLEGARSVVGSSRDVLERTATFVPSVRDRLRVVSPGVEVGRWRPRARREALLEAAEALEGVADETAKGRPGSLDREVREALDRRDGEALDALARRYDQAAPDPDAAARLRLLAAGPPDAPVVGYLGKLIPQKGVDVLLCAVALLPEHLRPQVLVIGFGTFREWLHAVVAALDAGDAEAAGWLRQRSPMPVDLSDDEVAAARGLAGRVTFTGRLDHRFAPEAVAALDVLVVPSVLEEAFGMVAAEGAGAGALPLVARHSGLAEIAAGVEGAVGRPGHFSFEPGPGATRRIAEDLERLLSLSTEERDDLRAAASAFVGREWTWERTAERLIEAHRGG
jgi:glycosyltransferase involved in cell wall biosynthesis